MPALYLWLNCASTVSQLRASERLREDTSRTAVTYRSYHTKSSDKKAQGEEKKGGMVMVMALTMHAETLLPRKQLDTCLTTEISQLMFFFFALLKHHAFPFPVKLPLSQSILLFSPRPTGDGSEQDAGVEFGCWMPFKLNDSMIFPLMSFSYIL